MTSRIIVAQPWRWISAVMLLAYMLVPAPAVWAQRLTFTMLTINDVYEIAPVRGRGGLAELATLLNQERATAPHHITTVNGDFLSPSLMSGLLQGAQMIDVFQAIGVDMVVFGNHEFDFGADITKLRMAESRFTWLGANVLGTDGKPFGGAAATVIRAVGPFQIGFLGLLTPDTAKISSPGPGVTFAPVVPTAQAAVATLRQAGADVIVALTHMSIAEDRELARQVPEISVILGGHEHDPITWYEGNTLIHKSGYDAYYLGRIDLAIDKTVGPQGPLVTVVPSWRMIANQGVAPEPTVAAKVAAYTTKLSGELAQPLGKTRTTLDSRREEVRSRETTMGNLVADALRHTMRADVALMNGGGLRGDHLFAPESTLTRQDILRELPFGNVAVLVEITGANLLAALEHGVSQVEAKAGRFPQVAGMHVVYNPKQAVGSRVLRVTIHGAPLDPAASYRLATNDYLFKGGDGYASLRTAKPLIDASGGPLLATLVMQYISERGTVAPQVEGRIVVREE